ncbi:atpase asna1 [Anaeramoeba ignava]|uniref:Atpase asna1 n=1 Tax=Anaeramoeba ignava TaxID=1746090 RepID=A0A9Q0L564_ANAIG|nr:atpase asna1 [Anaeramoeba ignava]
MELTENLQQLESTLQNLLEAPNLEWILVGGKGGVGKTTISCSIAMKFAEVRESVLLISTDPAHNLSDTFDQHIGKEPTQINGVPNLFAMEIDPITQTKQIEQKSEKIFEKAKKDESLGFFQNLLNDLSTSVPGVDEMTSFSQLMKSVSEMKYSVIIFDTAPTGHTIRFLSLSETMDQPLTQILNLNPDTFDTVSKIANSLLGKDDIDDDESNQEKLNKMSKAMHTVSSRFKDKEKTTFVHVCIPEFLSIYETERMVQELFRFGIHSQNIVVNQLIFPEKSAKLLEILKIDDDELITNENNNNNNNDNNMNIDNQIIDKNDTICIMENCPLCNSRALMQQNYLSDVEVLYQDFHVVKVPLNPFEIRGIRRIKNFSKLLFEKY